MATEEQNEGGWDIRLDPATDRYVVCKDTFGMIDPPISKAEAQKSADRMNRSLDNQDSLMRALKGLK